MTDEPPQRPGAHRTSPLRRTANLILFALAVVGGLVGLGFIVQQIEGGVLDDARAYYDAAARLNAGLPLYPEGADPDVAEFYRYPPLLAILFRPLALLPYETAAAIWELVVLASFVGTIWWIGPRRLSTWIAIGLLSIPIAWSLAIAQAQVPLTFLTALGTPWSIAIAANLKLFPMLIAIWWIGRRDWRELRRFAAWMAGLVAFQVVMEPRGSIDFLGTLTTEQVGEVLNLSPFVVSPVLWVAAVLTGALVAYKLAPTRWGWPAAVALSILATPRLLIYMLMTFLAALRAPNDGVEEQLSPAVPTDERSPSRQDGWGDQPATGAERSKAPASSGYTQTG